MTLQCAEMVILKILRILKNIQILEKSIKSVRLFRKVTQDDTPVFGDGNQGATDRKSRGQSVMGSVRF